MSQSDRDTKLALSALDGNAPVQKKRLRKRRCGSCGLMYEAGEIHPDIDENGRQVGFLCDSCV